MLNPNAKPGALAALGGKVVELSSDGFTLEILNKVDADTVYSDLIPVKSTASVRKGQYVSITGELKMLDRVTSVVAIEESFKRTRTPNYLNVARIVGRMTNKETWDDDPNKAPFGYMLLRATSTLRAKFFRSIVNTVKSTIPLQASVACEGPLQRNPGDGRIELIIRDAAKLKWAPPVAASSAEDPFGGWGTETDAAASADSGVRFETPEDAVVKPQPAVDSVDDGEIPF